jgi:D-alanyl-D-alanine carboxypeptidase/D-alanyl-D-alanine-endopeptidase (penicillin-binding protein 4)
LSASSIEANISVKSIILKDSIQTTLPANAKWSFSAIDNDNHKKIADEGNSKDIPLTPGSVVKLFVTAAVLDLNEKERISLDTILSYAGNIRGKKLIGNLYLKGSGNAFLSTDDLDKMVHALLSKGITNISGDIVIDNSLFDINEGQSGFHGPAYSTPSPLGLDMHTVSISLSGELPDIRVNPPNDSVRINFNPQGKPGIRQIDDLTYEVSGKFSGQTMIRKRFPLKNPSIYAAWTFKTLLKEKGVRLEGIIKTGTVPSNAIAIYTLKSKDLKDIIRDVNNNSLNVMAENLLLILGSKRYGAPGTKEKGVLAIKEFLKGIGIQSDGMTLSDGSGLSHSNRITSKHVSSFLERIIGKPWFDAFYDSLPRAGIDGTLKGIGYINEHIRAKTGHLGDVYCLAGYIEKKNGKKVAFSYMVNVPGADLLWKENSRIFSFISKMADE